MTKNGYLTRKELCDYYNNITLHSWLKMFPADLRIKELNEKIIYVEIIECNSNHHDNKYKIYFYTENIFYDNEYLIELCNDLSIARILITEDNKLYFREDNKKITCFSKVDPEIIGKIKLYFSI